MRLSKMDYAPWEHPQSSQLLPPSRLGLPVAAKPASAQTKTAEWSMHVDRTGRNYYHDSSSGTTQWSRPAGAGSAGSAAAFQAKLHEQNAKHARQMQHLQRMVASQHGAETYFADPFGGGGNQSQSLLPVVPSFCEICWTTNGKHAKKCANARIESEEQKAKRMKREERLRDQELGAEYVDAETQAEKTFTDYIPSRLKNLSGLKEHPDPVTETSALNSIKPPPITYKIKIPRSVILGGILTNLQLEAILYACDQHQRMLPYDQNKGETPVRGILFFVMVDKCCGLLANHF